MNVFFSTLLGLGIRPTYNSTTAHRITVFIGNLGSAPTTWIMAPTHRSHTEPRVTFHERGPGWFVGVWPEDEGVVRVTVFDMAGDRIDEAFLADDRNIGPDGDNIVRTVFPVEIACDNHLVGVSDNCRVYVDLLASTATPNYSMGEKATYSITINPSTGLLSTSNGTAGGSPRKLTGTRETTTGWQRGFLVDVATKGNGWLSGDHEGSAFLITQDNFKDLSNNEVVIGLDNDGRFNPPSLNITSENSIDDQPNVTSWDWNESIGRFVAISRVLKNTFIGTLSRSLDAHFASS